jgi:hypothetical protein
MALVAAETCGDDDLIMIVWLKAKNATKIAAEETRVWSI